jgi:hypothetical protein
VRRCSERGKVAAGVKRSMRGPIVGDIYTYRKEIMTPGGEDAARCKNINTLPYRIQSRALPVQNKTIAQRKQEDPYSPSHSPTSKQMTAGEGEATDNKNIQARIWVYDNLHYNQLGKRSIEVLVI